ncbi:lipocalin-like domain-containing protein [Ferrimonas aestuarii]|uniref:AttH domain-containing protein n=1 Tax=Ferrimonas aestuarii TaxID=2569539 RepID=A0A4U1BMK1_9GAMM|nr:lipocalin-like domain-containing protein [Ferrimonas aestuarii]TKB54544.1 hypothetical protein FCL42_12080 [Ferrimonas aestuarii]
MKFQAVIWLVLALLLAGCQPQFEELARNDDSGAWFSGLQGDNELRLGELNLRPVTSDYRLSFPKDHGAHPDYGLEWWYLTANLNSDKGHNLALQWTLFRTKVSNRDNEWDDGQLWFAHLAMEVDGKHHALERWARGGSGQAGGVPEPFSAWLDDWQLASVGQEFLPLALTANSELGNLSLTLSDSPIVLHGKQGFSQKTPNPENASHYYSLPHLRAQGRWREPDTGRELAISGQAWIDREWSSGLMDSKYQGWDWLSLHLDDGRALMLFRMRGQPDYYSGSLISADGQVTQLDKAAVDWQITKRVNLDGSDYPVGWGLSLPEHNLTGEIRTLSDDQRNQLRFAYWEGPVTATGTLSGEGFIEMTGY